MANEANDVVPAAVPIANPAPATYPDLILTKGRLDVQPGQDFALAGRICAYDAATGQVGQQVAVLDVKVSDLQASYPTTLGPLAAHFLQAVGGLMQKAQLEAMIAVAEHGEAKDALLAGLADLEAQLKGE